MEIKDAMFNIFTLYEYYLFIIQKYKNIYLDILRSA